VSCDHDGNLCTLDKCSGGTCQTTGFVVCPGPAPCYTAVACTPATAQCDSSGYVGDAVPCGPFGIPTGVCAAGVCNAGKACAIDGQAYAAGDLQPGDACYACQPGYDRTTWTPLTNGIACPGGYCVGGGCSPDFCFIDGVLYPADAVNSNNPCESCQPTVERTAWSPRTNGAGCTGGFCVGGSCDPNYCFIDGAVYANGTVRPGLPINWCQYCDVTKSRTSWSALPTNSSCGKGCLSGICQVDLSVGCQILGTSACASTDCGIGFCNPTTGQCALTPRNVGGACSQATANECVASQGTCDASGNCQRGFVATGTPCVPVPPVDPCFSDTAGQCHEGFCYPTPTAAHMSPCVSTPPDLCNNYFCNMLSVDPGCDPLGTIVRCDGAPGCAAGVCQPSTGTCEYPAYPNGTRKCSSDTQCCPGHICAFPSNCGQFCLDKYCYYPGTN
jgi:hypothetical protein